MAVGKNKVGSVGFGSFLAHFIMLTCQVVVSTSNYMANLALSFWQFTYLESTSEMETAISDFFHLRKL